MQRSQQAASFGHSDSSVDTDANGGHSRNFPSPAPHRAHYYSQRPGYSPLRRPARRGTERSPFRTSASSCRCSCGCEKRRCRPDRASLESSSPYTPLVEAMRLPKSSAAFGVDWETGNVVGPPLTNASRPQNESRTLRSPLRTSRRHADVRSGMRKNCAASSDPLCRGGHEASPAAQLRTSHGRPPPVVLELIRSRFSLVTTPPHCCSPCAGVRERTPLQGVNPWSTDRNTGGPE